MPDVESSVKMKKLCFEIFESQYFFLKEKVLELEKQNQRASLSSVIRDLIEKDRREYSKKEKSKQAVS